MKCGLITPEWGLVGATLACASDEEQAEFFNAFSKEVQSFPTTWAKDMQMFAIGKRLTPTAVDVLKDIIPHEEA